MLNPAFNIPVFDAFLMRVKTKCGNNSSCWQSRAWPGSHWAVRCEGQRAGPCPQVFFSLFHTTNRGQRWEPGSGLLLKHNTHANKMGICVALCQRPLMNFLLNKEATSDPRSRSRIRCWRLGVFQWKSSKNIISRVVCWNKHVPAFSSEDIMHFLCLIFTNFPQGSINNLDSDSDMT